MKKSALAITGLVVGVVALATSFMPIINNVSFFVALLGAALSVCGLVATVKRTRDGKALAIAGLIVSLIAAVVVLASQSFYTAALDDAFSGSSTPQSDPAQADDVRQASQPDPTADSASSKYAVTIDGCELGSDYSGEPAVIISYTFTNNSSEDEAFSYVISDKCFQNGVQLEAAIMTDIDSSRSLSAVKPGASISVKQAFLLDDQSDVTVECTELFDFKNTVIASAVFSLS